ncbi:hypothetical protein [Gemmatimonas sp.]|uniref:hypothetical protein n=1 Tax=Gemmatimonas sp. TaxID=1962908 RepID=UPI00333F37E9
MRDPTVTSYLPTLLQVRTDLQTALNRIDAYEVLCHRREWAGVDTEEKQTGAFHTVCARVAQAYNRLDLGPTDRQKLVKIAEDLRTENSALRAVNERQRETIANLNAALVERAAERV